jgi:hypothetical protein
MRIYDTIILWHAPIIPYNPPLLSANQLTCVIQDLLPQNQASGLANFLTIPRGEFDLAELFRVNFVAKPKYLFVCIDSTLPYLPRNLKKASEQVYICLGDTHHLSNPISRLRDYIQAEPADGLIFTNNVRHCHWFRDITNARFYYEPAIFANKIINKDYINRQRNTDVIFYGQIGKYHPRRSRIAPNLIATNKVKHIGGSNDIISNYLHSSAASLNITLNADLNSRTFEIAQTGCLLIIDKLSIYNGHGSILIPGHNCITFKNAAELEQIIDNKEYLLAMQKVAGMNLYKAYNSYWGIDNIIHRLRTLDPDGSPSLNTINLQQNRFTVYNLSFKIEIRLAIYEQFLELHRTNELIHLFIDSPFKETISQDISDLPRITVIDDSKQLNTLNASCAILEYKENESNFKIYLKPQENKT